METELQKLQEHVDKRIENGVTDFHFMPSPELKAVEEYAKAANIMYEAIEAGNTRSLDISNL